MCVPLALVKFRAQHGKFSLCGVLHAVEEAQEVAESQLWTRVVEGGREGGREGMRGD
jgi:hypothetical protein